MAQETKNENRKEANGPKRNKNDPVEAQEEEREDEAAQNKTVHVARHADHKSEKKTCKRKHGKSHRKEQPQSGKDPNADLAATARKKHRCKKENMKRTETEKEAGKFQPDKVSQPVSLAASRLSKGRVPSAGPVESSPAPGEYQSTSVKATLVNDSEDLEKGHFLDDVAVAEVVQENPKKRLLEKAFIGLLLVLVLAMAIAIGVWRANSTQNSPINSTPATNNAENRNTPPPTPTNAPEDEDVPDLESTPVPTWHGMPDSTLDWSSVPIAEIKIELRDTETLCQNAPCYASATSLSVGLLEVASGSILAVCQDMVVEEDIILKVEQDNITLVGCCEASKCSIQGTGGRILHVTGKDFTLQNIKLDGGQCPFELADPYSAMSGGGSMRLTTDGGTAVIVDCDFANSECRGGSYEGDYESGRSLGFGAHLLASTKGGDVLIIRSEFANANGGFDASKNSYIGSSVLVDDTRNVWIEDCMFSSNVGTAFVGYGGKIFVNSSTFVGNHGANGGAIFSTVMGYITRLDVWNTHFEENTAQRNGGIASISNDATWTNNTGNGNRADGTCAGVEFWCGCRHVTDNVHCTMPGG
ncbi:MAG: hypothetical protein SGILL_006659 [Bacillariaceae sp.]